jgi:DNA-binding CsgD family transcriptional regulator
MTEFEGRPIEGPEGYEETAARQPTVPDGSPARLIDPLSKSEIRVLRYLPTHLSRHEIANELYLSPNTVKTHMRHLYDKLGTHRRAEAVERARARGLLAPGPRTSDGMSGIRSRLQCGNEQEHQRCGVGWSPSSANPPRTG